MGDEKYLTAYQLRDLALAEMGYASYPDYLASDLWKSIRQRVIAEKGNKCSVCDNLARVIHHRNYEESTLEGRDLYHLIPLCIACHEKVEFWPDGRKRGFQSVGYTLHLLMTPKKLEKIEARKKLEGRCKGCGQMLRINRVKRKICRKCAKRRKREGGVS